MKISVRVRKGNHSVDHLGRPVAHENSGSGRSPETPDGFGGNGYR